MRNAENFGRLHERILETARAVVRAKRRNEFTVQEIAQLLRDDFPELTKKAIRTDVTSSCRQSAPDQNTAIHGDFKRIGHGAYRLLSSSDNVSSNLDPRTRPSRH
jgi:hypothetical protein